MSDIRNFFGGKGSQGQTPKPMQKSSQAPSEKKGRGRPKRKVLTDSEDEEASNTRKIATPKNSQAKKNTKLESPEGEVTTTSDYFAKSGKSKPTRSTPVKAKSHGLAVDSKFHPTRSTPKSQSATKNEQTMNGRSSGRKRVRPSYKEDDFNNNDDDDADLAPVKIGEDENSGEDVFEAEYNTSRKGAEDQYESDGDSLEIQVKPRSRASTTSENAKPAPQHDSDDEDVKIMDVPMAEIPEYKSPSAGRSGGRGRKRKSIEAEEEDFEAAVDGPAAKKSKASVKAPTKKANPKKKASKDEPPARAAVDDIFESIPTVRAPTPPPRDGNKKFDWKAAGNRAEVVSGANSIDLPTGAENCLAGLSFVFTGVLETLQREAGQELVKRYAGKVTGAPSKKTSFVVLGSDAGPKKLETIKQYGIKTIDEHGLFELIRCLPAHGGDSKAAEQSAAKAKKDQDKIAKDAAEMEEQERVAAKEKRAREQAKAAARPNGPTKIEFPAKSHTVIGKKSKEDKDEEHKDTRLWTVKYAPTSANMICGNKRQVEKLQAWLHAWPHYLKRKFKLPGKDGSGIFRAIMIHGPPGIGKTTAAHLVARLEGYDVVESNASDTRSKKLVEQGLKGVLDTTSLLGYFAADGLKVDANKKKLVLIMDEVDGMSAGDRGGVGALANVCRKTTVPMILICNERRQPKMKPFDSVAFDLPFRRPTVDMIRSRIMTICYKEGLKLSPNVVNALIEGSHSDIRQIINMLSTAKLNIAEKGMDFDQGKKMSEAWEKHVILKPWDIVTKILAGAMFASSSKSTLNDKIELYFNDHEMSSLMLQENYLGTTPIIANGYSGLEKELKQLELTDMAAESISDGDLVDRMIHGSQQQWALMPTHAVFSFVRPASFVSGSVAGHQTRFTSWLGNNSKLGKNEDPELLVFSKLYFRQAVQTCKRNSRSHAPTFLG